MTKWLPTLLPILGVASVALAPAAQDFIAHHAVLFSILSAVAGVLNHWLPSPVAPAGK